MAFSARCLRVLIASPSDVEPARVELAKAIYEWNDLNAQSFATVLLPTLWEISASPEMGDHPQAIVNRQIVDSADILIGAFWTRLGSPTEAGISGTAEEIERFIDRGAHTMIYFSSQPVAPDTLDPEQLASLAGYRKDLMKRGLCGSFETLAELGHSVQRDLTRAVLKEGPSRPAAQQETLADPPSKSGGSAFGKSVRVKLKRIAITGGAELTSLIEGADSDGVRRLMKRTSAELLSLLGTMGSEFGASPLAEYAELERTALAAAKLERFQLYIDGGSSWRELQRLAQNVITEVERLADFQWDSLLAAT